MVSFLEVNGEGSKEVFGGFLFVLSFSTRISFKCCFSEKVLQLGMILLELEQFVWFEHLRFYHNLSLVTSQLWNTVFLWQIGVSASFGECRFHTIHTILFQLHLAHSCLRLPGTQPK